MFGETSMPVRICKCFIAVLVSLAQPLSAGATDAGLRAKILAAFAGVRSYRVTVLGSVRSLGVWQSPNRYEMITEFEGKTVKTIIVGRALWQYDGAKWTQAGTASSNLDVDIAGLVRTIESDPRAVLTKLPDQTQDHKRVGTFEYTFADGTEETCNYDPSTYRVTRCKADELTLLYSAYNDPSIKVVVP
jgi:hypothetical protein